MIHHDSAFCNITVLLGLDGPGEPLVVYPELGPITAQDVVALGKIVCREKVGFEALAHEHFGKRFSGGQVELSPGQAIIMRGRRFAHALYEQRKSVMVCAACYTILAPPPDFLTEN